MCDDVWLSAVDVQPRQRVAEDVPVRERALRMRMRGDIKQPSLKDEHLSEALDVSAGERQVAQAHTGRPGPILEARQVRREPEGHQERPKEDGVCQHVGNCLVLPPECVERSEALPERFSRATMKL